MTPTKRDFEKALQNKLLEATEKGMSSIMINSGELHRAVGSYPDENNRMPLCCHVMRDAMRAGDKIIQSPPKGQGASLIIEYNLQPFESQPAYKSIGWKELTSKSDKTTNRLLIRMGPFISLCVSFVTLAGVFALYQKITKLESLGEVYRPQRIIDLGIYLLYMLGGKWLVVGFGALIPISLFWWTIQAFRKTYRK